MAAKCPKCDEEIEYLNHYQREWGRWLYREGGEYTYEEAIPDDCADSEYCCPECGELLAGCEETADKILSGQN